ncbi:hypothetical protein P7K49_018349 [Saguinus oedipus]|uniref:Uncharacterized protein n=1 Tax=Saguinus oedipus TaxID=9490 RepID=A0ABQ9V547_SAGOE|nr:hypothetical protein P7K49_018349 [Saguinus oedipus]
MQASLHQSEWDCLKRSSPLEHLLRAQEPVSSHLSQAGSEKKLMRWEHQMDITVSLSRATELTSVHSKCCRDVLPVWPGKRGKKCPSTACCSGDSVTRLEGQAQCPREGKTSQLRIFPSHCPNNPSKEGVWSQDSSAIIREGQQPHQWQEAGWPCEG